MGKKVVFFYVLDVFDKLKAVNARFTYGLALRGQGVLSVQFAQNNMPVCLIFFKFHSKTVITDQHLFP